MTKKRTSNKVFADLHLRLSKEYQRKLAEYCDVHGYDLSVMTKKDILLKIIDLTLSNDGVEKLETEKALDGDYFDCNKLCKKARGCTSQGMFHLGEIKADNCYLPNYPKYCHFLMWEGSPYGDAENPYPRCIAKQKDVDVHLPRDRIMREPQICWKCMKIKKRKREEAKEKKLLRKATGRYYNPQTGFGMGGSEGLPPSY